MEEPMRQVCYAIVGKTKMYMSESCVCEDADCLDEELKNAREDCPEEDYKIVPLFTLRRDGNYKSARGALSATQPQ
jgi:hypothetical protein